MESPLVSILIPSYNPSYFDLALRSATGQSYKNIEIIVSDDCPTNEIFNIIKQYSTGSMIRYERNPNPDGVGYNNCVNLLRLARGEYVKFLLDDDILMPFCVQYMVDGFLAHQNIAPRLITSERWFIDEDNRFIKTNTISSASLPVITEAAGEHFMATRLQNIIGEFSTAMWRREDSFAKNGHPLFSKIGDKVIDALTDVAMWINLARLGPVLYVSLPLSCFRIHGKSSTAAKGSPSHYKIYTDWELIVDHALENGTISAIEASHSYSTLERMYRQNESAVWSLKGHGERLGKKIMSMTAQSG